MKKLYFFLFFSIVFTTINAQVKHFGNTEVAVYGSRVMRKNISYFKYTTVPVFDSPVYGSNSGEEKIDPIVSKNYAVLGLHFQKFFPFRKKGFSWGLGLGYQYRKLEYQQLFTDTILNISFVGLQYNAKYNTLTTSASFRYRLHNTVFEIGGVAGTILGKTNSGSTEFIYKFRNNQVRTVAKIPKNKFIGLDQTVFIGVQQKIWNNLYLTSRINYVTPFGDRYVAFFSHRRNNELIYDGKIEDGRFALDLGFSWHFGNLDKARAK